MPANPQLKPCPASELPRDGMMLVAPWDGPRPCDPPSGDPYQRVHGKHCADAASERAKEALRESARRYCRMNNLPPPKFD